MWLRFKFSLFLPPLYFFLSLSLSLYFSVSRVPLSSLFNALPFLSTILHPFHFVFSPFFAPFSLSFYLPPPLLPRCVDIFFLFPVYNTFTTMPFFFSFLSLSFRSSLSLSVSIAYIYANLPSSLFFVHSYSLLLPFTYSLSHAFSVPLAPTPSTLTHSAFFLVRLLTRSVSFMTLSSLSDSRSWSGSLFARQPSPLFSIPHCHLVIVPRIYESSRVERC